MTIVVLTFFVLGHVSGYRDAQPTISDQLKYRDLQEKYINLLYKHRNLQDQHIDLLKNFSALQDAYLELLTFLQRQKQGESL